MKPKSAAQSTKSMPAEASPTVQSPKFGLIRPGGPVNTAVPGTGTATWNLLEPTDIEGEWTLKTPDGFALCRLMFSMSKTAEGGDLTAQGVCPEKIKRSAAWRVFPKLNQIALIDGQGGQVGNFRRVSEARFMIYDASIGSLTLQRP